MGLVFRGRCMKKSYGFASFGKQFNNPGIENGHLPRVAVFILKSLHWYFVCAIFVQVLPIRQGITKNLAQDDCD